MTWPLLYESFSYAMFQSTHFFFFLFLTSTPQESTLFPRVFANLFSLFSMYLSEIFFHHTYTEVISEVNDVSIFLEVSINFKLKQVQMLSPKFLPGFVLLGKVVREQNCWIRTGERSWVSQKCSYMDKQSESVLYDNSRKVIFHYKHKKVRKTNTPAFRGLETRGVNHCSVWVGCRSVGDEHHLCFWGFIPLFFLLSFLLLKIFYFISIIKVFLSTHGFYLLLNFLCNPLGDRCGWTDTRYLVADWS